MICLQLAVGAIGPADADSHTETAAIKYVMTVDYPLGGKVDYVAWVKSIAEQLQAPVVLQRIASYDNAHGSSPNRIIELEFASMADAGTYFDDAAVSAVLQDLPNHGLNSHVNAFVKRSDYSKN